MSFDPTQITAVTVTTEGAELVLAWTSPAAEGAWFQIYVAGRLLWTGTGRVAALPYPSGLGANVAIVIGTVGAGEETDDFAGTLATPHDRAAVTWQGGTWERTELPLAGFHVYMSPGPGGAVNYASPAATVPAYVAGVVTDGYGFGPYGGGGWGEATGTYSWTSGRLSSGTWTFAVKPFDAAGNEGTARAASVTIAGPPRPPAPNPAGLRLTYSYDPSTRVATLGWLASPG